MRASKKELPKTMESKELVIQEAEWGDMHIGYETYNELTDLGPLLKGLPDNRCQSAHWGYVIKGRMLIKYKDYKETISAGDAYYLPPGHIAVMEAGTEIIEFSPKEEYSKTMETVELNLTSMPEK
jgi:mannose-6-phosphate isomerase-like protein (cupin superfamily)